MSADNQIVVLAHHGALPGAQWKYAAMVVGHPYDLQDPDFAFDYARKLARKEGGFWFTGPGASSRAREMAHLLFAEYCANVWLLEYEGVLFVECSEADGSVWHLNLSLL